MKNKILLLFCSIVFVSLLQAQSGSWIWMNGSSSANAGATWGTMGQPDSANSPGSVYECAHWTDMNGRFWVLGGVAPGASWEYNTLWMLDPATNEWTWMKGNTNFNSAGVYGTMGVSSPANYPGARGWGSASWTDTLGNLWLFGGWGYDINGSYGPLGDLWKYNIASNEWTWVRGSQFAYFNGSYGTQLVSDSLNNPPARQESIANWVDDNGNLWMYGGLQTASSSSGYSYLYSDMWKYDPSINEWTWMNGIPGAVFSVPNWGTMQVPASSNTPGGRGSAGSWKDDNGRFWLYGGSNFLTGVYGDMWMYDPATNLWTWMAGASGMNPNNTFTTQHIAGNGSPGRRMELKTCWTDDCGRFWAYGGFSYYTNVEQFVMNDIWMFDPATNLFTWKAGQNTPTAAFSYGTLQVPAPTNYPRATAGAPAFMDSVSNAWMFGGWNYQMFQGSTNSLWRYEPTPDSCNLALSLYDAGLAGFLVYPNPSSGTAYVQIPEKFDLAELTIEIYDAAGRLAEKPVQPVSRIAELQLPAAGMYAVLLRNGKGQILGISRIIRQ